VQPTVYFLLLTTLGLALPAMAAEPNAGGIIDGPAGYTIA
jgi:hypothetical protein